MVVSRRKVDRRLGARDNLDGATGRRNLHKGRKGSEENSALQASLPVLPIYLVHNRGEFTPDTGHDAGKSS